MKQLFFAILTFCSVQSMAFAQARYVTLQATGLGYPQFTYETNELGISAGETAQVVSVPSYDINQSALYLSRNTSNFVQINYGAMLANPVANPLIVAGPAIFRLRGYAGTPSMVTFKIIPEAFPTDKTLIIPAGTTGATVTLECSTNLTDWISATNGFYSATNTSTFFRIRADRVQ